MIPDFDLLAAVMEQAIRIPRRGRQYDLFIVGRRGNEFEMAKGPDDRWVNDQRTSAEVLTYDPSTGSMDWKAVYRSSKGIFIKKRGTHYITIE